MHGSCAQTLLPLSGCKDRHVRANCCLIVAEVLKNLSDTVEFEYVCIVLPTSVAYSRLALQGHFVGAARSQHDSAKHG